MFKKLKRLIQSKKGDLSVLMIIIIPTIVATVFGVLNYNAKAYDIKREISSAIDSSLLYVSQTGLNGEILDEEGNKHYVCIFPDAEGLKVKFDFFAKEVFFEDGIDCYNPCWKFETEVISNKETYVDTFVIRLRAYVPIGSITNWDTYYLTHPEWNEGDIKNIQSGTYYTFDFEASTQCRGKK